MRNKTIFRVRYGHLQAAVRDFHSYERAYMYAYGNAIRAQTAKIEIIHG